MRFGLSQVARSWLLIIGIFSLGSSSALAKVVGDLYGEAITLEEEGGYGSSLSIKAKLLLTESTNMYVGAVGEVYEPKVGGIRRASPLVGFEKSFGPVRAFAEYRYQSERPKTSYSRNDPRFGFVGGYWWQKDFLFSDSYGQLISVPRIRWIPSLTAFSKFGMRKTISLISFDSYIEAAFQESPDVAMGRDVFELRGGGRVVLANQAWSSSISVFHRIISFRSAPDPKIRFLFSVGGNF